MNASVVLQQIQTLGVILVVRAETPEQVLGGVRAVLAGGLKAIEVTFTVPQAPAVIRRVDQELGKEILLGAGTVTTARQAEEAVAAGARYLVAPNTEEKVIGAAKRLGVAVFPGAFTPTEVQRAWELGADAVKLFPASLGGPAYLKALKGPFPHIPLIPTGGVDEKTVGEFFRAGAFAVGAGGALFDPKKLKAQDWAGLTATARAFLAALTAARS